MKLNRHFVCLDGVHIHRRVFFCRSCGKTCKPSKYKPYQKNRILKIAVSYGCDNCNANNVTSV